MKRNNPHIIYIIVLVVGLATSCASRKNYNEHTSEARDSVVTNSCMVEKHFRDSVIHALTVTGDSVEVTIEPVLIPGTDSVGEKITVKMAAIELMNDTHSGSEGKIEVLTHDSARVVSNSDRVVQSESVTKQDGGATVTMIIVVVVFMILIVLAFVLLWKYLK